MFGRKKDPVRFGNPPRAPKVLVVGAGAVGQTYALAMQKAGAEVSLFVKEKYRAECEAGLPLYRIAGKRGRRPETLQADHVFASTDEALAHGFDQIWVCLSSTAFLSAIEAPKTDENSISRLIQDSYPATIVSFQPGHHVAERYEGMGLGDRLVCGGIALISYQAPLVESEVPVPGVAYWSPTPSPFSGPRADEAIALLKAGDLPATKSDNANAAGAYGSATLMPVIAALEMSDWDFATLRSSGNTKLAAKAAVEAREITASVTGFPAPAGLGLVSSPVLKLATFGAKMGMPLPIEPYLKYHFLKVGDQTVALLDRYILDGEARGFETSALRTLLNGVHAARG